MKDVWIVFKSTERNPNLNMVDSVWVNRHQAEWHVSCEANKTITNCGVKFSIEPRKLNGFTEVS